MSREEKSLECRGCKCKKPDIEYDIVLHYPAWFGRYECSKLVEFICSKCWGKGVRYG